MRILLIVVAAATLLGAAAETAVRLADRPAFDVQCDYVDLSEWQPNFRTDLPIPHIP